MKKTPDPEERRVPQSAEDDPAQGNEPRRAAPPEKTSRSFDVESLEPRILMSATWAEAELGEDRVRGGSGTAHEGLLGS